MTVKELLIPRFEVIANYPLSGFDVNQILTPIKKGSKIFENIGGSIVTSPDKYPHLFRKMNWWEKRTVEQMPKKLVSLINKDYDDFDISKEEVLFITKWDMNNLYGIINDNKICDLTIYKPEYGYIPVD